MRNMLCHWHCAETALAGEMSGVFVPPAASVIKTASQQWERRAGTGMDEERRMGAGAEGLVVGVCWCES